MKRLLLVLLVLIVGTTVFADDRSPIEKGDQNDPGISSPIVFPTVAKNQTRPGKAIVNFPDVENADPGGGELAQGSCNCKRYCSANGIQCTFTGDLANQCKINSNNTCGDCNKDCGVNN